jgi:hypothetical protein
MFPGAYGLGGINRTYGFGSALREESYERSNWKNVSRGI